MTILPSPSDRKPEFPVYERMESNVRSYCRSMPRQFVRAGGPWMYDSSGGRYLDFMSGCGSLNYGHNHPALKQALLDYIGRDGITHSLDLHTDAKQAFLEEFEKTILTPRGLRYKMMFPGPTGTNSVEAALKLARKVTGRPNVIAFTNGFHGMTLGSLACTGNESKRFGAGVTLSDVSHEPFDGYFGGDIDTADMLEKRLTDSSSGLDPACAILVETVQGEGGLNVASPEWLRKIARIATQHGSLLIVDDIQAGCGRTGGFFSFEEAGVKPDMVTMAKSLSGMGLPFALTLIKPELDIWNPGEHNGTFRGNNHAFVTATAALRYFWRTGGFAENVRRRSDYLAESLEMICTDYKGLFKTKGRGMMRGIDVGSEKTATAITAAAFQQGLVIETSGASNEVVKVLAPLNIEQDIFAAGLGILRRAFRSVLSGSHHLAAE